MVYVSKEEQMTDEEIVAKSNKRVFIALGIGGILVFLAVPLGYYIHWLLGLSLLFGGLYIPCKYGYFSKEELEASKRLDDFG